MRTRLRRARAMVAVLLSAVFLSVAAYAWVVTFDPRPWVAVLLAAGPLVLFGLPAWLMLYATIRRGDPYARIVVDAGPGSQPPGPASNSGSVTPRA